MIALDLGLRNGWARSDGTSGVYEVPKAERVGIRFHHFRLWLTSMLRGHTIVAYEKAFVMPRGKSTELFFGFTAILEEEAAMYDLELVPVNAARLKKWTTGYGRASKATMLDYVMLRWDVRLDHVREDCPTWCPDPSHDEADAIAILKHVQETRPCP